MCREMSAQFHNVYNADTDSELDKIRWVVEVPVSDKYGNRSWAVHCIYMTSRQLFDMIDWGRFDRSTFLEVAEDITFHRFF